MHFVSEPCFLRDFFHVVSKKLSYSRECFSYGWKVKQVFFSMSYLAVLVLVSHEKIKGNVGKPISGEVGNIPIIQKPGN